MPTWEELSPSNPQVLSWDSLSDTPPKPESSGEAFKRGAIESFKQLPQLGYGVLAGAGAVAENVVGDGGLATGVKNFAVKKYQEKSDDMAKDAKPNDEFSIAYDKAKAGDIGALGDWLAHGLGYVGGQAVQMVGTAGIGSLAGKVAAKGIAENLASSLVSKEAAAIAASEAGAKLSAEAVNRMAVSKVAGQIGEQAALAGTSFGMEGGEIFGDLVQKATKEGRQLTGDDLFRAGVGTTVAGLLEYGEKLTGLAGMKGKLPLGGTLAEATGFGGRFARGVAGASMAAPLEYGQEFGQTLAEEYGKGDDPFSEASFKQAKNAAALGALGGSAHGIIGGALTGAQPKTPQQAVNDIANAPDVDSAIKAAEEAVNAGPKVDDFISNLAAMRQQVRTDEFRQALRESQGVDIGQFQTAVSVAANPVLPMATRQRAMQFVTDSIAQIQKSEAQDVGTVAPANPVDSGSGGQLGDNAAGGDTVRGRVPDNATGPGADTARTVLADGQQDAPVRTGEPKQPGALNEVPTRNNTATDLKARRDAFVDESELVDGSLPAGTEIHDPLLTALRRITLGADQDGRIESIKWAIANGRHDIADMLVAQSANEAVNAEKAQPGVDQSSPKYESIKAALKDRASETSNNAESLARLAKLQEEDHPRNVQNATPGTPAETQAAPIEAPKDAGVAAADASYQGYLERERNQRRKEDQDASSKQNAWAKRATDWFSSANDGDSIEDSDTGVRYVVHESVKERKGQRIVFKGLFAINADGTETTTGITMRDGVLQDVGKAGLDEDGIRLPTSETFGTALGLGKGIEDGTHKTSRNSNSPAQAQAAPSETPAIAGTAASAKAVPAAPGSAGVEAAGVEPAKAPTNRTAYVAEVRRQLGDLQPGDVLENDMGDKWTVDVVMRNKAGEVTGFLPREGNPETGEREWLDLDAAGSVLLPTPYLDASGNRKLSQPGKVNRAQPATPAEPQTEVPAEGAGAVEAAGLTENKVGRKDSAQIAQPESVVGDVQRPAAPSAITPTTTQGNANLQADGVKAVSQINKLVAELESLGNTDSQYSGKDYAELAKSADQKTINNTIGALRTAIAYQKQVNAKTATTPAPVLATGAVVASKDTELADKFKEFAVSNGFAPHELALAAINPQAFNAANHEIVYALEAMNAVKDKTVAEMASAWDRVSKRNAEKAERDTPQVKNAKLSVGDEVTFRGPSVQEGKGVVEAINQDGSIGIRTKDGVYKFAPDEKIAFTKTEEKQPAAETQSNDFVYNGVRIYKAKIKFGNTVEDRFAVESNDNKQRRESGDRNRGGDSLFATLDEAKADADRQIKRDAQKEESAAQIEQEKKSQDELKKALESDNYNGFLDGLPENRKALVRKALSKELNFQDGGVMTIRARIEGLFSDGNLEPSTDQVPVIQPMSRAAFNRATQREQDAHEKKMREAGTKTEYLVNGSLLGKTGYDYSKHLLSQKQEPAAQATAILDAAEVKGKERIDVLKDVKAGTITPEEVKAAYPPKVIAQETTDAQKEQAENHAKNLGGRVVWQNGDIALIEGFSALTGDSVYVATNGESRTRVDIRSYTGNVFSEKQKAELLKAREDSVKASDAEIDRNPNGPFADSSVVFADDIPSRVQGIVRSWIAMLGLDGTRIVVTTPESGAQMADGLAGRFRRIGKANLSGDNTNGVMQPLGGNDFHIAVRAGTSILKTLEILAHELGHIVERTEFANANEATKQKIQAAHAQWMKENGSGSALDMAKSMRAYRSGMSTGFNEGDSASQASGYWKSFGEWFADQVSRWATTQEKPVGVVSQFFKRLADKLKSFFVGEKEKFLPNATVTEWLNSLSKDAPLPAEVAATVDESPGVIEDVGEKLEGGRVNARKALFNTIQTREDESGNVAMFARNPFYSALYRGIEGIKANVAPANGWKDAIKGLVNKGIAKADEVEWSGLNDWLDLQTGKVQKADLLAFMDAHGVKVEETTLGLKDTAPRFFEWLESLGYTESTASALDSEKKQELTRQYEREHPTPKGTKYDQYTIPGGENYREVLLTLPVKARDTSGYTAERLSVDDMGLGEWQVMNGNRYVGNAITSYTAENAIQTAVNRENRENPTGYKSAHWDEKNVLAHIRVDDRTDADGAKVLMVQEIQSDWGQQAKKDGIKGVPPTDAQVREYFGLKEGADPADYRQEMMDAINRKAVPNAPFIGKTDAWLNLALKRIITMAVDGGYDKVAFVNGEQSADRYDLSKQIDTIGYLKHSDGTITIEAEKDGRTVHKDNHPSDKIDDVIGKELAQRIIDSPDDAGELSGLDLKVGGSGMITFYDKIVPNAANALLKKVGGGKLETISASTESKYPKTFSSEQEAEDWANKNLGNHDFTVRGLSESQGTFGVYDEYTHKMVPDDAMLNQPGFTITDAMRDKASEGLPLFQRGDGLDAFRASLSKLSAPKATDPKVIAQVQAWTDELSAKWENGPSIRVVSSFNDLPVPATSDTRGLYYRGTVYIVAGRVGSKRAVGEVLAHESVAHYGLREMLGQTDWQRFMGNIQLAIKSGNKPLNAIRDEIRSVYVDENGKPNLTPDEEADEIAARVVEKAIDANGEFKPGFAFVKSVYAKIAQFLRDIGLNVQMTHMELQGALINAQRYLEAGQRTAGGGQMVVAAAREDAQAARNDQTQTPEFKRWFGDSKVVDQGGKPLVVYHGGRAGTTKFRDGNQYRPGIFFTDSKHVADAFGVAGDTYPVYLKADRLFQVDAGGAYYSEIPRPKEMEGFTGREEVETDLIAEWAFQNGYDGVQIQGVLEGRGNSTSTVYIVPQGKQIKSATGNNGDFDPANPDIRYARGGFDSAMASRSPIQSNTWNSPSTSKFDNIVYTLQNKQIDTKRVVEAIKQAGKDVAESVDVYLREELFHGRSAKRTEDFLNNELTPLLNDMKARGISLEQIDKYLHARHAEEANKVIASRNPDMPDGGSGMNTQEAKDYLNSLGAAERNRLDAVAKKIDGMIATTRQLYADEGLESQETVDSWGAMFKHYVPLMREDKDGGMGIGQGFSIKGKESKGRVGSSRAVVDILANIAMQREKVIVRGEKNRVATALVGLATENPNPDFWTVGETPHEKVYDPKTNSVVDRIDPMYKSRENVVVAKVKQPDGNINEVAVVFNGDNDRAVRMAASLKNLDALQLNGLLGVSAKISRYISSINTQYNPIFGIVNLARDVQGAMVNLSTTELKGQQKEVSKHVLSALKGVYLDARAVREGKTASSKWAALNEEFQNLGGQTGYRDLFATSEDRAKALQNELMPYAWMDGTLGKIFTANGSLKVPMSVALDKAKGLFDWLSDYNLAMENAVRLSAFKVGIDQGMSKERAASLAKNLTVNFNRKGQISQQAGALYAFFNAGVQGTARLSQVLFEMDGSDHRTIRLSATGKKVVAGGIMLGVAQAVMLAAAGFGDDDPPEFVRERNLIIPTGWTGATGDKAYITIPMPLGLHVLPNIGRVSTEFALGGFRDPVKRAAKLFGLFTDAFNPMGGGASLLQILSPTPIDPLVALAENKDGMGRTIAKTSRNPAVPGFTLAKDTASKPAKMIAEAINYLSGGTEYKAGVLSPTPDQVDFLIGQATGGVGREISKGLQTASAVYTGEELPTHKIPLVGRFYGDSDLQSAQSNAFYSAVKRIEEHELEIKGLRKDGKSAELAEYMSENPEARLVPMANRVELQIQNLQKRKRELMKRDADAAQIKAVENQITERMKVFNMVVRNLREKQPA